jgi:hypothetical protein
MNKQLILANAAPQDLKAGQKNLVKMTQGQHFRVQEIVGGQPLEVSDVVAVRRGQDLSVKYADGTEILFQDFYGECGDNACSVNLGGETPAGYTINGDSGQGAAINDGGQIVYAYGDSATLTTLSGGEAGLSSALGQLGSGIVTYVPPASVVGGSMLGLGALAAGGGLALAAGAGGSVGSAVVAVADHIVAGAIVAGPVTVTNDLLVTVYAANGTTVLGTSGVNDAGQYSVNVGSYTGVVIARLTSTGVNGTQADYHDEATGGQVNLTATLMASTVVPGGTVTLNINPLTTIAALKAAIPSSGAVSGLTAVAVSEANAAVASAFGLNNLISETVITTIDATGSANSAYNPTLDGLSNAEKYGAILAALSGLDQQNGGVAQTAINDLVAEVTASGNSGTLSAVALNDLIVGAVRADAKVSGSLIDA